MAVGHLRFALVPTRDFVLPILNPSPLRKDFKPPNPILGGYLGAISSRCIFELVHWLTHRWGGT